MFVGIRGRVPVFLDGGERASELHFFSTFPKSDSLAAFGIELRLDFVGVWGWRFGHTKSANSYSLVKSYLWPLPRLVVLIFSFGRL